MVKNLPAKETWVLLKSPGGDPGLIPGLGRSPGEGNGNPFQYSYLENPLDRGAWQATVHGVTESDMTKGLSTHAVDSFPWTVIIFLIHE